MSETNNFRASGVDSGCLGQDSVVCLLNFVYSPTGQHEETWHKNTNSDTFWVLDPDHIFVHLY